MATRIREANTECQAKFFVNDRVGVAFAIGYVGETKRAVGIAVTSAMPGTKNIERTTEKFSHTFQ